MGYVVETYTTRHTDQALTDQFEKLREEGKDLVAVLSTRVTPSSFSSLRPLLTMTLLLWVEDE